MRILCKSLQDRKCPAGTHDMLCNNEDCVEGTGGICFMHCSHLPSNTTCLMTCMWERDCKHTHLSLAQAFVPPAFAHVDITSNALDQGSHGVDAGGRLQVAIDKPACYAEMTCN